MIAQEILELAGRGLLNCHMGILPRYRGMDVVEWPVLEERLLEARMTVHVMDKGVDIGDILRFIDAKVSPCENIKQLRERFEPIMCRELAQTSTALLAGKIKKTSADGRWKAVLHHARSIGGSRRNEIEPKY